MPPKTVGPNLATMTIRERAALAWEEEKTRRRERMEGEAVALAEKIFGRVDVLFDGFIPDDFAARHNLQPYERITFELEDVELLYAPEYQKSKSDRQRPAALYVIERCPCGRGGYRFLSAVRSLADFGWALAFDYADFDTKCRDCHRDELIAEDKKKTDSGS